MRLRFLVLTIFALLIAACSPSTNDPGSATEAPETPTVSEETAEPTVAETETAEPTETETTSALPCETLPEVTTTEGEEKLVVPENAVVVFHKTGGFAGVDEVTVIYADGHIENNKNEEYEAPPEVIGTLLATAADAGFFDMDGNYIPENHCCDYFNYSLTVRNCEQMNTVMTSDDVPGAPTELTELINTIQALVANTSAAVPPAGEVDLDELTPAPTSDGDGELTTRPVPGTPG